MARKYKMHAASSADTALHYWTTDQPDWTAAHYDGPGTPSDVVVHSSKSVAPTPAEPSSISGLALWLDGRSLTAFSDSGGTVTATATGPIRRIDQPSPLTGSWLAPSDSQRVFREASGNALDVPQGNTALVAPAGVVITANSATMGFSFTRRDARANGAEYLLIGNDGVYSWGVYCASNNLHVFYQGIDFNTGIVCLMNVPVTGVVRWMPTGVDVVCDVGGVARTASASGTLTARSVAALTIGFNTDNSFNPFIGAAFIGIVSQLCGYNRAISDTERTTLQTFLLANKAPVAFTTAAPFMGVEGDSISTSALNFFTKDSYVYRMLASLWGTSDVRLEDAAISGSTIADVLARFSTTIIPFLSTSRTKNVVILAVGTNSLTAALKTAAQYWADYQALADAVRAAAPAGAKIVGQTVLPRTVGAFGTPSSFEADRTTFNALALANWGAHFDGIANVAAVTGMGAAGNDTNLTNYQDGVHPTSAGMALLEPTWTAAVRPFV